MECTGSRERRSPRRLLRPRNAALALVTVIVAAFAYVALAFVLRGQPGAKSLNSAVRSFQSRTSTTLQTGQVRYKPPKAGVYTLKGHGGEKISFPPASQNDSAVMPMSVTYAASGCWLWRIDYNVAHWEEYEFCPRTEELKLARIRNFQSWDFGVASVKNLTTVACAHAVTVLPADLSKGNVISWTCPGSSTAIHGASSEKTVARIVGTTTVRIGGVSVRVIRDHQVTTLRGAQRGTDVEDWWFDGTSGLPLRETRQLTITTSSPVGDIRYTEKGSWQVASLSPRT